MVPTRNPETTEFYGPDPQSQYIIQVRFLTILRDQSGATTHVIHTIRLVALFEPVSHFGKSRLYKVVTS